MGERNSIKMVRDVDRKDRKNFKKNMHRYESLIRDLHKTSLMFHSNFNLCLKPLKEEWNKDQREMIPLLNMAIFNELVAQDADYLRQRSNDGLGHGRRMIEMAAFVHECSSTDAFATAEEVSNSQKKAKKWRHGSESLNKMKDAKGSFSAHQIVKKHFAQSHIYERYDLCCGFVHPSPHSVFKNLETSEAYNLLRLHDADPDKDDTHFKFLIFQGHAFMLDLFQSLAEKWERSSFDTTHFNKVVKKAEEAYYKIMQKHKIKAPT